MTAAETAPFVHQPVLLAEAVAALAPHDGGIYVDGTFGAGGYSQAILAAASCRVWAIDRDPAAVAGGAALATRYPGRFKVLQGRFGDMARLLGGEAVESVDGIALDVGVSSPQIDDPARGFSFAADGPLDMRMDPTDPGPTAADLVNTLDERALADLIFSFGEEPAARRIARAILRRRAERPFTRTRDLAEVVRAAAHRGTARIHPATLTFQALRIAVNDEIGELRRGLQAAEDLLAPGGRLVVVAFHSLEDREVKQFLYQRSGRGELPPRHRPPAVNTRIPTFRLVHRKAIRPRPDEIACNPRARSARLRAAERVAPTEGGHA